MDEKEQIRNILKGDTSAFNYFVETYQDMAISIAYQVCENRLDAEDIVQESFVKAFRNLHTFRLDSKFSTWLYRIVYNTSLAQVRTSQHNTEYTDYSSLEHEKVDWDVVEQMAKEERKALIEKTLSFIPKDERVLLTLFYLDESSIKDIVQITGLSESNTKVKLHRARKHFSEQWQRLTINNSHYGYDK